jgi:NAD(P)-dependent dehydrogenase (short-subunit alcohol dehydrogenase family)
MQHRRHWIKSAVRAEAENSSFGEAEEVVHVVSFPASEKSSYITGEVINVNGGLYS